MTPTTATAPTTATSSRRGGGIFVALVPWVLFTFLAAHGTVQEAALVALAAAVAIALPSLLGGRLPAIELGAVATFAAFAVVAFAADGATADLLARYARAIAAGVLAAIAFGSLLFTPFTEQYARESAPREVWDSPPFKAVNRRLTTMWASVFAAMVPLHVLAGAIDTQRANLLLNWAIPVLMVVWAAKRTGAIADAQSTPTPVLP